MLYEWIQCVERLYGTREVSEVSAKGCAVSLDDLEIEYIRYGERWRIKPAYKTCEVSVEVKRAMEQLGTKGNG